jgi:hypothetical protein
MPLALAAIPEAEAKSDAPPTDPASAAPAKPAEKPKVAMVKKRVVRVEHHQRGYTKSP